MKDAPRQLLPGRTVPSICFVFRVPPAVLAPDGGQQKAADSPATKLQQSLEKQLTFLLRRIKATEGESQTTLFHLSAAKPLAFLLVSDPPRMLSRSLFLKKKRHIPRFVAFVATPNTHPLPAQAESASDDVMTVFDDVFGDGLARGTMLPYSGVHRPDKDLTSERFWASLSDGSDRHQNDIVALHESIRTHIARTSDPLHIAHSRNRVGEQPSSSEWFVNAGDRRAACLRTWMHMPSAHSYVCYSCLARHAAAREAAARHEQAGDFVAAAGQVWGSAGHTYAILRADLPNGAAASTTGDRRPPARPIAMVQRPIAHSAFASTHRSTRQTCLNSSLASATRSR